MAAREQQASPPQRKSSDPLLDQSGFAVERLPMLAIVFEQLAAGLIEGMRTSAARRRSFRSRALATGELFEILAASKGSVGAVLHSPELDCRSLAIFDQAFVLSLVQILLGGDARRCAGTGEPPVHENRDEPGPENLGAGGQIASSGAGWAGRGFFQAGATGDARRYGHSRAARRACRHRNISFSRRSACAERWRSSFRKRRLQPIRQKLAREISSESVAGDPRWTRQMQTGVSFAEMTVKGMFGGDPDDIGGDRRDRGRPCPQIAGLGNGPGQARMRRARSVLVQAQSGRTDATLWRSKNRSSRRRDILDDIILG